VDRAGVRSVSSSTGDSQAQTLGADVRVQGRQRHDYSRDQGTHVDQTGLDSTYEYLRKQFDQFFDGVLKKMASNGQQEAAIGCQIGVFEINRLTQTVSLIDKPDIAPEHQSKYDTGCRVIRDVAKSKGFEFLEF
jgi:hypothetical protein